MEPVSRESLQQRYADLVDAELLRRLRSNALTELAREVALAELTARGVSPDAEMSSDAPSVPDEIDFAPDEFASNPYQAPRSIADTAAASAPFPARFGVWDVLWFIYAAILASFVAIGLTFRANPLNAATLIETFTTGFALTGILAWRLRRAWLHPIAWVACIAISLAWLAVMLRFAWTVLALHVSDMAVTVAVHLPLYWGLARYAFFSPSIWRLRTLRPKPDAS
jgi:hypothetical protein